jgi:Flp pilus assembly pilin Flp
MQRRESGQSLAEYTIILSLVGIATLAGTAYLGAAIKAKISALTGSVAGVKESEITREDERAQKAFRGASESAASVSGMKIETKGKGREIIGNEELK